jgi:hypothetical protein
MVTSVAYIQQIKLIGEGVGGGESHGDAPHGLVAEIVELTRIGGTEGVGGAGAEERELGDFGDGVGDGAAL